jgi:cell division transport system ATP-binding protein
MIEFSSVTKIYGKNIVALDYVTFQIKKGEFVFIVGASGAGKSTIIKLLNKEEDPTKGNLYVNGKSVVNIKRREIPFLRRSIGVVFQDFRLLLDKTVFENIAFAMRVVEASNKDIKKQVPQMLDLVGLSSKGQAMPNELSGGEQQRVALARAIVNNPTILIADEPTGNLDPETSWGIMELLDEINKRGTTVVMATHAKEIVNRMKKRVIAINDGKIVRDQQRGAYLGYEN